MTTQRRGGILGLGGARRSLAACVAIVSAGLAVGLSTSACAPHAVGAPKPLAPLPAPRPANGTLTTVPLLGDLPARIEAVGGGPPSVLVSAPLVEGERAGAFVDVPKDLCLLAYARGASSLDDLDLAAFSDDGSPVAVDEGPDPAPAVLVCPPHPSRLFVAVHAAGGQGLASVAAQFVRRGNEAVVARIASAKGALGGTTRTSEAWPGLDDRVRAHRASLGGTWSEIRRVAVDVDARMASAVAFAIDEGTCTDALVVPDPDVALVDADVLDASGRLLGRLGDAPDGRAVTVCSPMAIAGSLQIRPHVGRGLVAVVLSRSTPASLRAMQGAPFVAWAAPVASVDAARSALDTSLAKAGYGSPIATSTGQLALGRRAVLPIDVGAKGCRRIDVMAGAPLALVDGAVWADDGALLARAEGSAGATFFVCGHGKARLDLGTSGRPGPYTVSVRAEPWTSDVFAAHPLAASRMLDRAATGPNATFEGAPGAVRHVVLEADREYVENATIPAGACLAVAMGAQGDGAGIEVRLVDVVDGTELDRTHGERDGKVRACAEGAARTVRLEAHATAGRLDAVVGPRLVDDEAPKPR